MAGIMKLNFDIMGHIDDYYMSVWNQAFWLFESRGQ